MDLLKSFSHPEEVMALLKFKLGGSEVVMPKCDFNSMSPSLLTCYNLLNRTSRSFSAVIQALDGELRNAVCIFYLVLRALDTVEDDMTIPIDIKIPMLKSFYKNLQDPDWKYMDSKDKDRCVLESFQCYCHYVAGLVGIGLARLFSTSGLEEPIVGQDTQLANDLGLFLQKTNIIRDYLEDYNDKRIFWPKVIIEKIPNDDPNSAKTRAVCQKSLELTETEQEYTTSSIYPPLYVSFGLMLTAISYTYWSQISQWYDDLF